MTNDETVMVVCSSCGYQKQVEIKVGNSAVVCPACGQSANWKTVYGQGVTGPEKAAVNAPRRLPTLPIAPQRSGKPSTTANARKAPPSALAPKRKKNVWLMLAIWVPVLLFGIAVPYFMIAKLSKEKQELRAEMDKQGSTPPAPAVNNEPPKKSPAASQQPDITPTEQDHAVLPDKRKPAVSRPLPKNTEASPEETPLPVPAAPNPKQEKFNRYDKNSKDGLLSYGEFTDSHFAAEAGDDKKLDYDEFCEIDEVEQGNSPDGDPKGTGNPDPEMCLVAPMAVDAEGYEAAMVNIVYWQAGALSACQLAPTETVYFVYRAETGADGKPGAWKLITPEPLSGEQYQDTDVDEGKPYFYAVAQASKDTKIAKGKEGEYQISDKTACLNGVSVVPPKLDWRFVNARKERNTDDLSYTATVKLRRWYRGTSSKVKGSWLRLTLDLALPADQFMGGNYFVNDMFNGKVLGMACALIVECYDGKGALTKLETKDARAALATVISGRMDFSTGLKWPGIGGDINFERNGKPEKFTEAERKYTPDWDKLKPPRGANFPPSPDNK